jgi:cytochrome c oxidase subunit 4
MMEHRIVPLRVYYTVFALLLVLTAVTVAVSAIDLGPLNTVVALAIACLKATLVILYFMHVRYGTGLTWLVVLAGFVWLGILLSFTLADVVTRGWLGA